MTKGLVSLIRLYQRYLSPLKKPCCRFYPTCSHYAIAALEKYGPIKGSIKAIWRLLRCHPFAKGGIDYP